MPPKDRQRKKRQRGESQGASQRSQSSTHRGSRSDKKKKIDNTSRRKTQAKSVKGAPPETNEKYVVIIQNVENDFTKVHQYNLPAYCHLVPELNQANLNLPGARGGRLQSGKTNTAEGEAETLQNTGEKGGKDPSSDSMSGEGKCTYSLLCRSETRSAELTVRGAADASIHTIFASPHTASTSTKRPGKAAEGTSKSTDRSQTPRSLDEGLEITEETSRGPGAGTARGVFSSLEEMAKGLCHRPYFTHPPRFHVNLPGRESGEVLLSEPGKRRQAKEKGSDGEEKIAKTPKEKEGAVWVRQFPRHQRDLVSAVAVVLAGWGVKDLRRHLRDLPGFLSCWRLYAKHFRVVFRDQETLFKAKQLLDQFHVEGNVRVEMKLSDIHSRSFAEFITQQEQETAAVYG
ncbi:unnamed protein product [Phytomonas sp. EM1]|nr:unnamed protein product [Phytomonas sp. EM1]|eukprot:CCW61847.1 unnamed protein product [Phytomonas sp. isolate EM1]